MHIVINEYLMLEYLLKIFLAYACAIAPNKSSKAIGIEDSDM